LQLVSVSRGEQERGKEFARVLARKLAFQCLSQEEVADLAVAEGIAVGKLETAVVKKRHLTERQVLEKEHYLAFFTRVLCERAREDNLVFHGRAGHLAVPGLTHVLRIRTQIEPATHIEAIMQRLNLDRAKAREYVERVDEDITRWVRMMYNISGDPWAGYDLAVNLDRVEIGGATTSMCGFAQLPEFQATPATDKTLENLLLAARVRIALARDERTWSASFSVRANSGRVTISYLPSDMAVGARAPEVVEEVSGVTGVVSSVSSSNILWVQEHFRAEGPTFEAVVKAANSWQSSIELMKLVPAAAAASPETAGSEASAAVVKAEPLYTTVQVDGGIEADVSEPSDESEEEREIRTMFGELNARGIAGSTSRLSADMRRIRAAVDRSTPYSLVVVDEVFLDQTPPARIRKTRELVGRLGDVIAAPVVSAEDFLQMVHTSRADTAKIAALALTVVAVVAVVFGNQRAVLEFFAPASAVAKALAAAALLLIVPLFAVLYGTLTTTVLKKFHLE